MKPTHIIRTMLAFAVLGLTACGGGSSGGGGLLPSDSRNALSSSSSTSSSSSSSSSISSSNSFISSTSRSSSSSSSTSSSSSANEDSLEDVRAWQPSAPNASALYDCALADTTSELCTLEELPLLGMQTETPSVADIMGRVLVSHDWMAERFEEVLLAYPEEILPLFRGLTAIVIDDDIRPAFYSSNTGAIYLDPFYLWTNNAEKTTINPKEDYRAGFSDPLAFRDWGRYLHNGDYAFSYGSLDNTQARPIADVVLISARLLLHELAHVNDFLPYDSYSSLTTTGTVPQAIDSLANGRVSDQLSQYSALTSSVLSGLGQVMYRGATPSVAQTQLTAAEVGAEFEADAAADSYAYSSQFEDLAMLFEIAIMKRFWDLDYQVVFVEPIGDAIYCDEYLIGWAGLNWLGDTDVKDRAMFVTNALLPDVDLTMFYQDLAAPTLSSTGDWCLPAPSAAMLAKPTAPQPVNPLHFQLHPH